MSKTMLADLLEGSASEFYFVPIVVFKQKLVLGLTVTKSSTVKEQIVSFLNESVETPLLEEFLSHPNFCNIFYNVKTVGPFEKGNKEGGSPKSGAPDKPLLFEEGEDKYAWESVSAAAKCLGKDRKSIRLQRDKGTKLKNITKTEYENFKGVKISNANPYYFDGKQDELQKLKKKISSRW